MSLRESWWEEKRSAYLYGIMAEKEINVTYKQLFLDLAKAAEKQALLWETKIKAANEITPIFKPDLRTRIVILLIGFFGTARINTILAAMNMAGGLIIGFVTGRYAKVHLKTVATIPFTINRLLSTAQLFLENTKKPR